MIVYLITHTATGRGYVGQTMLGAEERFAVHQIAARSKAKRRTSAIARAIKRFGPQAFTIRVLERCADLDGLNAAERKWIERLGVAAPAGFNIRAGGNSGGRLSDATKQKLSRSKRGRKQTPEEIERRIAPLRGRPRSPETCAAISKALKGRANNWGPKVSATRRRMKIKLAPERKAAFVEAGRRALAAKRTRKD